MTKVTNTGTIQIPDNPALYDKEVEVIILLKTGTEREKMSAMKFVEKWAGVLANGDTDQAKFDYLSAKYKCI